MTEQEIRDWEREIQHFQMMQKQREGWDGKNPTPETIAALKQFNKIMEQSNEINR